MAMTIGKLRAGLVVATVALLVVIVGYIGYARRRGLNYLKGLPAKYGLDITTDGFKYSHALGGDTEFTVRAKRQIKHRDGKMTLYGVGIVVYGAKADRSDRISGDQFEYDQKTGELRGIGDVLIDLQAPATDADKGALKAKTEPAAAKEVDEAKVIHVKTRGLVFQEKDRSAATDERVDFVANGMTGNAVGASYDSKNGVVVLRSAVHLSGLRDEHPVTINAGRAEMDRDGHVAKLEGATAILETDDGARTLKVDHALVHVRSDGNPERVDGAGHVVITGEGKATGGTSRGVATGDRMQVDLNDKGQPEKGFLAGNVKLTNEAPNRREDGRGEEVHVLFDGVGRPVHSVMTGEVEMNVHEAAGDRRLDAAKVDLDLGGGGKEPVYVTGAVATGPDGARLKIAGKDKKGNTASGMRADVIVARFGEVGSGPKGKVKNGIGPPLVGLDGRGKTSLEQTVTDDKGTVESKQTSTGETLKVDFRTGADGKVEMTRTEQRGDVAIVREVQQKAGAVKATTGKPAKVDGPEVMHAKADDAVYVADADLLTLTGAVQVQDAESAVFADKVVTERKSGDSTAEGAVKVSYLQQGSSEEPMHVMATRAVSHKASGVSEFFAGPGSKVKMWQGGSQVEAPVLDFDRTKKTLVAKDVAGSHGVVVKSVIVDNSKADADKPAVVKTAGSSAKRPGGDGPMRVWSEEMFYADATRVVEFKGKVRAEDGDGVLHAQDALVYLTDTKGNNNDNRGSLRDDNTKDMALGGRVDHMVATGAIELDQPGRKATGDKLTYAASDQTFVLTGTKTAPPKMTDDLQGTTTGDSLRFRTGDDSVVVSSGEDAGKVRSETRLKQGAGAKEGGAKEGGTKGTGKKP